ncbi:hypothetical protein [Nocardia pseudovaccinii]|uniref:hypothetical protein n=1 Tax=Nocardia pseudovaccinii TaxID=189540 RepID=UPI0007A3E7E6|nr:hypothetical protein [Nocardia pseudovaccinii]
MSAARMTRAQLCALDSADCTGQLQATDKRTLHALTRCGWARRHEARVRKRVRTWWSITDSGRAARDSPLITDPPPRPVWAASWTVQRVTPNLYVLDDGHRITRPAQRMLWRVLCPANSPDVPLGHHDFLAEAVDDLRSHIHTAAPCTPTSAGTAPAADPTMS